MMVQRKANTGNYIDHFLRLATIKKQIDRLSAEREQIGELISEIVSSKAGVDSGCICAATGFDTMAEIDRNIADYRDAIYQLEEAQYFRDHSTLGGIYHKVSDYRQRIDKLVEQRVKLASMGVQL